VRLLIETGPDKIPGFPEVPTFKERGYPISLPAMYGLFGPARLPGAVVSWWEGALREMTETSLYHDFVTRLRGIAIFQDSVQLSNTVIEGYKELGRQIDALGLR
jgi:tripartite-type tricarboxylate transporter receptor subunit TctC